MDERERQYIEESSGELGRSAAEESTGAARAEQSESAGRGAYASCEFNANKGSRKTKRNIKGKKYSISRKALAGVLALCMIFSLAVGVGASSSISQAARDFAAKVQEQSGLETDANSALGSIGNFIFNPLGRDGGLDVESIVGGSDGESGSIADVVLGGASSALEKATASEHTIAEIVAMNENSVVEIRTESVATDSWLGQYITQGAGSGVVVSTDGYIVTNNHVIEGARSIAVTLKNGEEYTATLVGTDAQTDVAVIKINASGLTSAVFGDSDALHVGDLSVVIGNPLGRLGGTVTAGIVSALGRELQIDGKTMNLMQTDASINPGNSGGGMFNSKGELVGIVVAKSSGSDVEGLGFVIPINDVKQVADQLVKQGYVGGRPALGISVLDLTSTQNAIRYGVRQLGVYVSEATTDNAKAAGFEEGDMLYYVGEVRISQYSDIAKALEGHSVGDKVKVTVVRGNQFKELTVTLSERTN